MTTTVASATMTATTAKPIISGINVVEVKNTSSLYLMDSVANSIEEFSYKPEEGTTFSSYFRRYDEIIKEKCNSWSDVKNI